MSSSILCKIDDADVDYNPAFQLQCSGWNMQNDIPPPAKKERLCPSLKKKLLAESNLRFAEQLYHQLQFLTVATSLIELF